MKTIFLTVYDGDTEKVILRSGVFEQLHAAGHRIVLLVRGEDRLTYYRDTFGSERVIVELLPKAMTTAEYMWYHLGWNTLPTYSAFLRRRMKYQIHKKWVRYALESLAGFMGRFRLWRNFLRFIYKHQSDSYCANYFETYKPDMVFTPNMFSPEDMRMMRAAQSRGIPTAATAKSWDVLTTKAFTRVRADKFLVFNEFNRQEAIAIGDYNPSNITVTGFPQFDIYARDDWRVSRKAFCQKMNLDPERQIILMAIPGDWKTPYTKEILKELDRRIEAGVFAKPIQVLARLHPKYADSSEGDTYMHVVFDRPGTHFSDVREFSVDMGIANSYQWTFTDADITHLANSIHHADFIINTESTLTLDAAALGKPSILIGYDGGHTLPYWDSVARVYEREHYIHVVETGACPLVSSDDELTEAINRFLTDPEYLKEERKTLFENLLYKVDGKSAKRMADAVLSVLPV